MFATIRPATDGKTEATVVFLDESLKMPRGLGRLSGQAAVHAVLGGGAFNGSEGSIAEAITGTTRVIFVGLANGSHSAWVKAFAAAGRRLAMHRIDSTRFASALKIDWNAAGVALGLLSWDHTELRGSATIPKPDLNLRVLMPNDPASVSFESGLKMAASVNLARSLSQTPPNIATPLQIADAAEKMASDTGLKFRVIKGKDLEREQLVGLATVGRASENPPCLIRLEYSPKGASGDPLVLVGKTITYDTGGLSLKDRTGMVGMKRDKDGGCAALGAMHAIATVLKPNRRVVALLVAAENSVNGTAYRPDDVIVYRNGVSVEVTNTDAEGRLVLADGLCWAAEVERAAAIVDIATLTGGVVTALGKVFAGVFESRAALEGKNSFSASLRKAAETTGERVWPLPLDAEYKEMMKSPVADIVNSNPNRQAHPVQGAIFLSYFVPEDIPWIHLDIAGVHAIDKDKGPFIPGPTGFGVRLLAELASLC